MYRIGLKILMGDRAKYAMLIGAIAFATLLMVQQAGIFTGIMDWTASIINTTQASIWVIDSKVEDVNQPFALRDTDLGRVRSVSGVAWAVPLYQTVQQVRLKDGTFQSVLLMGIDASTFIGAPTTILKGRLEDLRQSNAILLDEYGQQTMLSDNAPPLDVGDTFELNDHEARIVGLFRTKRSFSGYPFVYTTYERAIEMAPKTRRNLSYVLVEPQTGQSPVAVARKIEEETGLRAYTSNEFYWSTVWWYWNNTGIPSAFGATILIGFIVGVAVAGQTFYMSVLDNIRYYGALKAMGATNGLLARILIAQAALVGFIGYGLGLGAATIFGYFAIRNFSPPFYMPYQILLVVFLAITSICVFSALLGIWRIRSLETAEVFRG